MPPRRVALALALGVSCGGPLPAAPEAAAPEPPRESRILPSFAVSEPAPVVTTVAAIPEDQDRTDADRALDPSRHPAELLAFFGIKPGERVAELGAGTGYTTELLARAVTLGGAHGVVYGENPRWLLDKFAEGPWSERLKRDAMKSVVRLDREFDDPFPPEVTGLDAVVSMLFYHDTVWLGTDRDKMNAAVFRALRPGGIYGVVDMSAQPNAGTRDVKTFHRIDEAFVKTEIEKAGFKLDAEADFLRNPNDARDWNDAPNGDDEAKRGTSDRFVLRFVKP